VASRSRKVEGNIIMLQVKGTRLMPAREREKERERAEHELNLNSITHFSVVFIEYAHSLNNL